MRRRRRGFPAWGYLLAVAIGTLLLLPEIGGPFWPTSLLHCIRMTSGAASTYFKCFGTSLDPEGPTRRQHWTVRELGIDTAGEWRLRQTVPEPPQVVTVEVSVIQPSGFIEHLHQLVPLGPDRP